MNVVRGLEWRLYGGWGPQCQKHCRYLQGYVCPFSFVAFFPRRDLWMAVQARSFRSTGAAFSAGIVQVRRDCHIDAFV